MKPLQQNSVSIILFQYDGIEEIVEVWDDPDKAEERLDEMIQDHDDEFEKMNSSCWSNGREGEFGNETYRIVTSTVRT